MRSYIHTHGYRAIALEYITTYITGKEILLAVSNRQTDRQTDRQTERER
jgi:hypothetical protein